MAADWSAVQSLRDQITGQVILMHILRYKEQT